MGKSKSDNRTKTNPVWNNSTNRVWRLGVVLAILISLFSFRLWQTTGCLQFKSFYLNPESIKIRVEEDVNSDKGVNRNVSRFFHNKLQTAVILASHSVASTIDARMLLEILGPLGLISIIISLYVVIKHKNLIGISHLIAVLIASAWAIISTNSKQSFYVYSFGLYSFCFWSAKVLAKKSISVIILAILTFWFFTLSWQLNSFCHDIFFN